LVGDDAAGVHRRQDALEQVLAARVWSPSFDLGRNGSQLLHVPTPPMILVLALRSVTLHNEENIRGVRAVPKLCDGGKVMSWRTRRNGSRSG